MLSRYLAIFTTLVGFAASAPTPIPASAPGLATVDLRIIGPHNNHYSTTQQSSSNDQSQHVSVIVGQTLSLDHDAFHIQGLQITAVKAGESLSLMPTKVEEDDWRVLCSARVRGREDLAEFDWKDKGVLLAEGRLVEVTRLSCKVDAEES